MPVQFVIAAFLIGVGTRMVTASAWALEEDFSRSASVFAAVSGGELVPVANPAQPLARMTRAGAAAAEAR